MGDSHQAEKDNTSDMNNGINGEVEGAVIGLICSGFHALASAEGDITTEARVGAILILVGAVIGFLLAKIGIKIDFQII